MAALLLTGTGLLMLPVSSPGPGSPRRVGALFTAVSALCVTGLTVVDTARDWTVFGRVVILALIQIGGLGVMTLATLLGLLTARRLGLTALVRASGESRTALEEARSAVRGILLLSLGTEALIAATLFPRFLLGHHMDAGAAAWYSVFHSISAFNNAGFALRSDNLMSFASDPWVLLPLAVANIVGGLGFPVLVELGRRYRVPHSWSLGTKLVLTATPLLLAAGAAYTAVMEWDNPGTLGALSPRDRLVNAFFHSAVSRTAGFNALDIGQMRPETWLFTDVLMLIGGGPAGTAGGVKVTTVLVLLAIVRSELRGDPFVLIRGRRLSRALHRQAITVLTLMLLSIGTVTLLMVDLESHSLDRILFEAVSAASTTGLSTGITADLSDPSKLLLCLVMFAGRVGPVTLGTALAVRRRPLLYEPPKERPLIG
ncbi:TrkH family potassium uptake protein [Brachybacterium sp. EF45031]|nr:TrkH family potassium uptake protein [Brachybacterium sillae]